MARCTITIEDLPNGKVKVETTPTFKEMMDMDISGHPLTSAQGYLFSCINHIRDVSKQMGPIIRKIPIIGAHR